MIRFNFVMIVFMTVSCSESDFSAGGDSKGSHSYNGDPESNDNLAKGNGSWGNGNGNSNNNGLGTGNGNGINGGGINGQGGSTGLSIGACYDARRVKSNEQALSFPSTLGQRCAIGSSGSDTFNAATEQNATITIPSGAILCSIALNAPAQPFKYDDSLFITFENAYMASSSFGAVDFGTPTVNGVLYTHNTQNLINRRINRYGSGPAYRAPGVTAIMPGSEQTGAFSITATEDFTKNFTSAQLQKTQFKVSLIVGGNGEQNDGNWDCQHSGINNLKATVKYVQ